VGDFMAPLALGTQTAASVIRPASFCGVVGFKSAQGSFPLAGVMPLAHSLDSLGWMCHGVADAELVYDVLTGSAAPADAGADWRPRIGLCRTPMWPKASPDVAAAMEGTAARLRASGWDVTEVDLGPAFADLIPVHQQIMAYEAAHTLVDERLRHADLLSPQFAALMAEGCAIDRATYSAALARTAAARTALRDEIRGFDALLTPSAPGEAPEGLGATGDPVFSRMWTLLGVPALTFPVTRGTNGLPVGLQLITLAGAERTLFAVARRVAAVLV
jgi:Asp-tRNA(Asn)/Glu-tRNA(Gln) amidotransferase A subunit family amidase